MKFNSSRPLAMMVAAALALGLTAAPSLGADIPDPTGPIVCPPSSDYCYDTTGSGGGYSTSGPTGSTSTNQSGGGQSGGGVCTNDPTCDIGDDESFPRSCHLFWCFPQAP